LATLQRQLEERGVSVDTPVRDLEECSDPARIQSAVQHYRELADLAGSLAIPAEHRPDDPPGGPSDSAARAGGPENEADEAGQAEELARLEDLEQRLLGLQATFTKREYQRPALQEVERQLARVRAAQKSLASDGKKHPAGMFGSMLGLAKRP
jgi:hypothetical protein